MSDWFEHFGYAEVADDLLVGAYPQDAGDVAELQAAGVTRIFNLVQDAEYDPGAREACVLALAEAGIEERRAELIDFGNLSPEHIELAAQAAIAWLEQGERVYLHCRAGMQRSATVAGAIVTLRDGVRPDDALELIRTRKPSARPLPHQRLDLVDWWLRRNL